MAQVEVACRVGVSRSAVCKWDARRKDFAQLGREARRAQRRASLVRAFWHQAELSL